jgi:hypothetical protein
METTIHARIHDELPMTRIAPVEYGPNEMPNLVVHYPDLVLELTWDSALMLLESLLQGVGSALHTVYERHDPKSIPF